MTAGFFSAKFELGTFQILSDTSLNPFAHVRGSREGDRLDQRVGDHLFAYRGSTSRDKIQHPRRQSRLNVQFQEEAPNFRSQTGRFEDNRIAAYQCRRAFPPRHVKRKSSMD